MAGDAYDTIQRFWHVQDAGDYTATVSLFADDALFVDPIYGTFEGRVAIAEFMEKMNGAVAKINGVFELVDLMAIHVRSRRARRGRHLSNPRR